MAHRAEPLLDAALAACGAKLIRWKKHRVYLLPNGRKFTQPKSRSDGRNGELNALQDLRRALRTEQGQ